MLASDARGCACCARNLEAERMIAKVYWTVIAPAAIILGGLLLWLLARALLR
jgi:hypothetical protein